MTEEMFKTMMAKATPDIRRLNATNIRSAPANTQGQADILPDHSGKASELERVVGNGAMGAIQVQERLGQHFRVVVRSFRKRLLDVDNLAEKYHVDLCRYAGIIPSDAPGVTEIEVCQEKVFGKEPERVVIEVWEI